MKKYFYIILLLISPWPVLSAVEGPVLSEVEGRTEQAIPSEAEEYALKSAFVYNFSKYIDWMPSTLDGNFIIGVVGHSPIIEPLREIARNKTVDGRNIIIRQYNDPEQMDFCHILFIGKNTPYTLSSILSKVNKGTLTVSEKDNAADVGVAFNFVIIKNKLKFEANTQAISSAGLKASSDLLKLAIIN